MSLFSSARRAEKFLADIVEEIAQVALSSPKALIGMNRWSLAKLREYLAVYDLETDRLFGRFVTKKDWRAFLSFLKWVRRRYRRSQTLHIVLDNYKPHLKAEVVAWAATHKIRFYFTPTNASWLNRIECQFTALKKFALNNSGFRSHEEQQKSIEHYLSWRNRRRSIAQVNWRK